MGAAFAHAFGIAAALAGLAARKGATGMSSHVKDVMTTDVVAVRDPGLPAVACSSSHPNHKPEG